MTTKNAPSSSKSKLKIIIPVAVVLTVAAMFLLFFFARSLFVIDLADYVTVELNPDNDGYVYDGNINCNVKIDEDKLSNHSLFFGFIAKNVFFTSPIDNLFYGSLDITSELETSDRGADNIAPEIYQRLHSDDVIKCTVAYNNDPSRSVDRLLTQAVLFGYIDRTPKTFRIKIADEIERQGLEVRKPVKINILKYVRDNNLIVVKKNVYGDVLVFLKPFEAEINGIKIVNDSESSTTCQMYDGNTYLGDIELSAYGMTHIIVPNNSEVILETYISTPKVYTDEEPYKFTVRVD